MSCHPAGAESLAGDLQFFSDYYFLICRKRHIPE